MPLELNEILKIALKGGASDIHMKSGLPPMFRVDGALNVPRSPQGYPLLVQAGSSEDGKELAAQYAEAVFTAQQTLQDAQSFYSDLKARARALGRHPDSIKILPGIVPALGGTEAEARALEAELEQLIKPEYARRQRLIQAQWLLARSNDSIAEIASRCGYSDQGHLARELRRITGMTPAAWRRAAWARSIVRPAAS